MQGTPLLFKLWWEAPTWWLTGVPYCLSWPLAARLWAHDLSGPHLLTGTEELEEVCTDVGTVREHSWRRRKSKESPGQCRQVLNVWVSCPASLIPNHFLSLVF